jgi:hypothetical protein
MEAKFFVKVPFAIKDKAKSQNAKFDPETKCWYVNDESEKNLYELKKVDVKYELKDIAKQNGAIWDQNNKCWVTCAFNVDNINNLMRNEKITVLVNKKNELMKNPEIKLVHEINEIQKESNKMIFPKW